MYFVDLPATLLGMYVVELSGQHSPEAKILSAGNGVKKISKRAVKETALL